MMTVMTLALAGTILLGQILATQPPKRIDVDCETEGALEDALDRAVKLGEVDIYLTGICRGNFVIAADGATLRAVTSESGLAPPEGDPTFQPVLEVVDARATLRGLVVQGGGVGVLVRGWDAEVLLYEVDIHGHEAGVIASRGARVRLIGTTVHDGGVGIVAESDSNVNLQQVIVSNQRVGIVVFDDSFAALNDTTVENNSEAGLSVGQRSDVNIIGSTFRENGQIHVSAADWSSVTLISGVSIGSEADTTPHAPGTIRGATIASFSTPVIHGDVSALIGGSIQLGNTVLEGDLLLIQFADAFVRNSEITGSVFCVDGADAICKQTTTGGAFDCPSPSCGSATAEGAAAVPSIPEFPVVEMPRFERTPRPARSRVR